MNILNKIIEEKKREINKMSPISLKPRKTLSLIKQFDSKFIGIIGEIKKGSPSEGILLNKLDLEPLVNSYNQKACAISVLTDQKFFSGGFNILRKVRDLTTLPLLCKDFIISPIQIDYAFQAGADAILLIKKILTIENFILLLNHAKNLSMDVLVEVDCLEDFKAIEDFDFMLCGINNRNLSDFSIDFNRTHLLGPYIKSKGKLLISESGIQSRLDMLKLRGDIDGCLIGQALVSNPSLINDLQVFKERIKVKICGIKSKSDALTIDGRVDYIGLVLCDSKRKLSLKEAITIRSFIKKSYVVGVFKNQRSNFIERCFKVLELDYVQIYEDIKLPNIPKRHIIRAISFNDLPISKTLYIVDGNNPGSGISFDTKFLKPFSKINYMLAGGLNKSNLIKRVHACDCIGVDVSSGVEIKGLKSKKLMLDFIEMVGHL